MFRAIAERRYRQSLIALGKGDIDAVVDQFDPNVLFAFAGESALGTRLHTREATRRWFERLLRLLPNPRFEPRTIVVSGWPWDFRIAAHVEIHSTVAGEPYQNEFAQFLRFRWGRVLEDIVLEDTQRFERATARLLAAGVTEAGAPPISEEAIALRESGNSG